MAPPCPPPNVTKRKKYEKRTRKREVERKTE
jgi:hypothetical protein